MAGFDFSNATPVLVLNMDRKEGGDASRLFHPAADTEIRGLIASLPLPDEFLTQGGITKDEFADRFTTHYHAAEDSSKQLFKGLWIAQPEEGKETSKGGQLAVELKVAGVAVSGEIRNEKGEAYPLEYIHLVNNSLSFTFRNQGGTIFIVKAVLDKDRLDLQLSGIEQSFGTFKLTRQT
jgi:hypothetical protein